MADRPIIFSAPMIRALLDGRKTQTRRVLKPQPVCYQNPPSFSWGKFVGEWPDDWFGYGNEIAGALPYAPGDRLWCKEGCVVGFDIDDNDRPIGDRKVWYRATDTGLRWYDPDSESMLDNPPWKPSIHMPRWASRLTLLVTDVRVQRLQEISRGDAMEEGCPFANMADGPNPRDWYRDIWNSIHGPDAWDANPWVAAISFTVHRCNIDTMEEGTW